MLKENRKMEIRSEISIEEKVMLNDALDGINGFKFDPITVITNGAEDYCFICKVKVIIKSLRMKIAKVHVRVSNNNPQLLRIEGIE
ncbi:MAG: hypothetical protein LKH93_09590 [Clostridium beijerinckii]|jgi:hypothetical protein|uniref:hypothetical protein n=1 Tax=Clostridium beijerinckii TaxID=1520 RepID=UPI001494C1F7|nr:hypothetical protein [Clostridium beijerinckii]MCI1579244.1 hypothetical protein [Clostridium beijerinckii]MCI1585115.1 hypothetical protein [Clostridium beijerinckii]MCI1622456.1 hypothetical protein [Clostridium beijerinckii]MDG5856160.1 hypothetical protein [Clostridium beijerinckii]NOW82842.1 hypothetical protein [Clostridium beijerinckii]